MDEFKHDTELFLDTLGLPENTEIIFLCIPEAPEIREGVAPATVVGTFEERRAFLEAKNAQGYGIFFTVQEFKGGSRRKNDFTRARALFVDLDGTDKTVADLLHFTLFDTPPSAIVETSERHFHVYWKLEDGCTASANAIEAALRFASQKFGGDPHCTDAPRVMRLPGFNHQKNGARKVALRWYDKRQEVKLPEMGVMPDTPTSPVAQPAPEPPVARALPDAVLHDAYEVIWGLPAAISGASGHANTFHVACRLAAMTHLDHDQRMAVFQKWNRERTGGKHWTIDELARKLRDAEARVDGTGWNYRDVVMPTAGGHAAFPIDCLPPAAAEYAKAVANFCGVDESVTATVALSVLATMIGRQVRVQERKGLFHYPALFTCLIMGTGERKSPVFKAMLKPLDELVAAWRVEWGLKCREIKRKQKAHAVALKAVEKLLSTGKVSLEKYNELVASLPEDPEFPPAPRLYTNDATEERLVQLLARTGEFAVLSGEARPVFNQILGRYAGGGKTGESVYLAAISGDTITRDRVSGAEELTVEHPCLNVCLMVQPDKYTELVNNSNLRDSGALARILSLWPEPRAGMRVEQDLNNTVPTPVYEAYKALLGGLRTDTVSMDDEIIPLSVDAAEARRAYHNRMEQRLRGAEDFTDAPDLLSKACSTCTRIALVLHRSQSPAPQIQLETWNRAERLCEWYMDASKTVRRLLQDGVSIGHAARTQRWLAATGRSELVPIDLVTRGPMPRPDRTQAVATMRVLEEHGIIMPTTRGSSTVWIVNPNLKKAS